MPRLKWPYALLVALYCVAIFLLSAQSNPPTPPGDWWNWPGADKAAHAVLFGGLAGLVAVGLLRSSPNPRPTRLFLIAVACTVLYGLTDEIHQRYVPHRTFDLFDLLADAVGATIVAGGIAVYVARFGGPQR